MRNLIFFTLFFLLCMNVLSLADESIDDDQESRASSADKAITRSPISFPFRLPSRWLNSHRHHAGPPQHNRKHHHHGHKPRHKHHGGHHNPPSPVLVPPPPPSDNHLNPPPPPKKDPQDCSMALIYVEGCVPDLISSYFGENVRVSANCCQTIAGLSGTCFDEAFAQFETPAFTGRVKGFCSQLQ